MLKLKKNKGITLIALVVIIVVLIILVGVTISIIGGDNGILNMAQKAKTETEKAQMDENDKLETMEQLLESNQEKESNNLTLFVSSDNHVDSTISNYTEKLSKIQNMVTAANQYNASFVSILGDCIAGKNPKEKELNDLKEFVDNTKTNSNVPVFFARGNHDDNGWYSLGNGGSYKENEIINDLEWKETTNTSDKIVRDSNNSKGNYFYYDDIKSKIRVFVLDTSDIPYYIGYKPITDKSIINFDITEYFIKNNNQYIKITKEEYNTYSAKPQLYVHGYRYTSFGPGAFSNAQLNFVANNLKSLEDGWATLFLMHIPLDTSVSDYERFGIKDALVRNADIMLSIISAYKNGTKCELSGDGGYVKEINLLDEVGDFSYNVNVDYSQKGKGEVIAFISGHTHWNNTNNEVGIKNSLSYGFRYISIGSEDYSILSINREKNTISVARIGLNVTPKTTTDQNAAAGVNMGNVLSGSIESGNYTVNYEQFYPTNKNLLNWQWSTSNEFMPGLNILVDMNNYNVSLNDISTDKRYETFLKAIPVKPYTTYAIGTLKQNGTFVGTVTAITKGGKRSQDLSQFKNSNGNIIVKTSGTQYALVLRVHPTYKEELMVIEGDELPQEYIEYNSD